MNPRRWEPAAPATFKLPEITRNPASFDHMADTLETSRAENRYLAQKTLAIMLVCRGPG